jgi:PilZ domain.
MNILTVHVRADDTATLVCPSCNSIQHFSATKYRHARHTLTVRCRCATPFSVLLNFRRHFRKPTNLNGTYEIIGRNGTGGGLIQVNNLSRGGAGFSVSGRHHIAPGQNILIEFHLNDKKKTMVKKEAVVRSVQQNSIGCEFKENTDLDKNLGFFLQN